MRIGLVQHPDSRCGAVIEIEVEVARPQPAGLALHYRVTGEVGALRLPPPGAPQRRDGLWHRTCFEAFLRTAPGPGYMELNLAPSKRWAAYAFDAYRSGMRPLAIAAPRIEARRAGPRYALSARLSLDGLASETPWQLGLAAVIEERDGGRSYWALAHPPGRPDFHHADCFACEVAAQGKP
ncbi:MAG: DOMON-like domain-containing protein [Kiloniellales bacterium]|nr:DOMON-like domain-containing protein [Kiloniellales bacterium]